MIKSCPKCGGSIQTNQHTFLSICPHCKKCVKAVEQYESIAPVWYTIK